ncbi:MAG: hypothetical protein H8E76_00340 [Helicobacteraceae bacterium]|nr:hypothetical protein [Candidatus Sulfurimonas ponti]MBL6973417.1 hypothetical protein [Sulfurimonas sp.]
MKTIKILIASLLLVSQSYAFGKSERNLLLGLGVGAVVATVLHSNNVHVSNIPHTKRVYVDTHHERKAYKKHIRKEERRHVRQERHYNSHHKSHHRYSKHDRHHNRYDSNRGHKHNSYAYNHRY